MKIAIVTNNYFPIISGISISISTLYDGLIALGHTVYIIAPKYPHYRDVDPSILRIRSLPIYYRANYPLPISYGKEIADIFEKLKIDIVHSHHPFGLGQSALIACKKHNNIPIIFTHHTLYEEYTHYVPMIFRGFSRFYIRKRVKQYIENCDSIIVPNTEMKSLIKANSNAKSINIIPTGFSNDLIYHQENKIIFDSYQLEKRSEKDTNLLCVSRVTEEKNITFLLKIIPIILSKKPKAKIILVGDGHLLGDFKKKIKDKYNSNVITFGAISHKNMAIFYKSSTILLFISKTDTQGLPLVESLPFGLPIIAIKSMASDEFVSKLNTGIISIDDPEVFVEHIVKLIDSKEQMSNFKENNIRVSEEFKPERFVKKVEDVYYSLHKRSSA